MIKNKKVELAVVKKLPVDLRGKISAKNSKKKGIIRFFRKVLKFELNNSFKIFTVKNKKIEVYIVSIIMLAVSIIGIYKIEISGKNAVVVGRSPILGKPMAMMLLNKNATVTICHSRTANLQEHIKNADILVGAVGVPRLIQKEWIKNGAVVIDAGYHPKEKCGDIDLQNIESIASAHTPVPGGVGPMTINTLILNTLLAAQKLI